MIFNSFVFVVFYLVVLALYWTVPYKFRWVLLLAASYFFYMWWNVAYIGLIILSTAIDYVISNRLLTRDDERTRKLGLIASVVMNLGLLFVFKYYGFFQESLAAIFGMFGIGFTPATSHVLLPVGISFYTFQTMSYTIDVYRRQLKPEPHAGRFALYVSFFPQLVAGPIERATALLPQLNAPPRKWDHTRFRSGLAQTLFGLFKKVCVADTLALHVDAVYGNHTLQGGADLALATVLFAFQIYCDFSGYSDIALGTARMMGIELMENFRLPYFSKSVTEFWQRWHISLSTWLRDYLYIPLGGNRHGKWHTYRNLMLTMLLGGLWHGANWNFVTWGGLNGAYLAAERALGVGRKAVVHALPLRAMRVVITFTLICITWVFFRSQDLDQALDVFRAIGTWQGDFFIRDMGVFLNLSGMLAVLLACEFFYMRGRTMRSLIDGWSDLRTGIFCAVLLLLIGLFGVSDGSQFIYFQF